MEDIQYIVGGGDVLQTLPNGQFVNIEMLEGYDRLSAEQKVYIQFYVASIQQETSARVSAGVTKRTLESWKQEKTFTSIIEDIDDLFREGLSALDYTDALTNSKVRGRVLQAKKAKGYVKESSPNNHLHLHGEGGFNALRQLISG